MIRNLFKRIILEFREFFHFIFYSECIVCLEKISEKSIFCIQCFNSLNFILFSCMKCGNPMNSLFHKYDKKICLNCLNKENTLNKHIDFVKSLFIYDNESDLMKVIFNIKNRNHEYIFNVVSKLLIKFFEEYILEFDIIIAVPSHFLRFFNKRFNTSELLASCIFKNICKKRVDIKITPAFRILKKIKNNKRQMGLTFQERVKNNQNAFEFNSKFFSKEIIKNKRVLIIDDVFTSGSTINECAKVLKQNGASVVGALTIGKTYLFKDY